MNRITQATRAGLTFDVTDAGPLDGSVVLLLHGFPANRRSWDGVVPHLHAAGFRTLAPDQRGYSPHARPRGRGAYRMAELVRDALAVADAAGADRFHVVGHDWGGAVAWKLALVAPQRLSRLTAVSTPHPSALRTAMLTSTQVLSSWYMGFFQLPVLPERFLEDRVAGLVRAGGVPPAIASRYAETLSEPGALTAALDWYRGAWLPGGSPMRAADPSVRVPTTYVWGRHDQALGRRAAELTRRYVSAPYRFVELDEGHWIPEVAPERLAQEILAGP